MPVHMTPAQAKALGIPSAGSTDTAGSPRRRRPIPGARRGEPPPVYICHDCQAEVVGEAGSLRHLAANHHLRYELRFELE